MANSICTLFEGHYHLGLVALYNSLYKNGFKGDFFVGYRGSLPPWASDCTDVSDFEWPDAKVHKIFESQIFFLPVDTSFHLTNYKPAFMLALFEKIRGMEGLIYYDPDIVNKCKWSFYETWIKCGVALVHEVISNDMPDNHPVRAGWRDVISKSGRLQTHVLNSYINGGFCGIKKENIEFLEVWQHITQVGIDHFGYEVNNFSLSDDRTNLFFAHDQDALNIAAMCCRSPISEMGPETMDFINGGWTMSHAVGAPKPWKKKFILSALKANPPGKADKEFWMNVSYPISCFSGRQIKLKKLSLALASLIGRFYTRN